MYILEASYSSFVVRSVPFLYDGDSYSKNFEFDVYDTTGRHLQRLDVSGALYFDGSVSVLTFDAAFPFSTLVFSPLVGTSDVSSLSRSISDLFSGNFNVKNVLIVVAAAVGLTIGIVWLWFNFHYIKFKLSGALRKGKL